MAQKAHAVVMDAVRAFESDAEIQKEGIQVLYAIVTAEELEDTNINAELLAADVHYSIMRASKAHPTNAEIQNHAKNALEELGVHQSLVTRGAPGECGVHFSFSRDSTEDPTPKPAFACFPAAEAPAAPKPAFPCSAPAPAAEPESPVPEREQ